MILLHRKSILFFFTLFLLFVGCSTYPTATTDTETGLLKEKALAELREVLHKQSEWVKVHAAEYLLWAGYPEEVREVFLEEEKKFGAQPPYRIGVWRVLAQAAASPTEKEFWISKIRNAFLDTLGKDRIHASETLAKLKVSPSIWYPEITRQALKSENKPLAMYTVWATAYSSSDSLKNTLHHLLAGLSSGQQDVLSRRMTGYILRQLTDLNYEQWKELAQAAVSEPVDSDARIYLLSAAFVRAPDDNEGSTLYQQIKAKLLESQDSPQKGARIEMALALAQRGTADDIPSLLSMLTNKNPLPNTESTRLSDELLMSPDNADVRAAAAYAMLKIGERTM